MGSDKMIIGNSNDKYLNEPTLDQPESTGVR
jgi:hypothetical protein